MSATAIRDGLVCFVGAMLFASAPVGGQSSGMAGSPELRFSGTSVEIQMPMQGGRSIVQARVGGDGPYDFFIDSGSGTSAIDSHIAAALNLEVVGTESVGAPGGPQVNADRVALPTMRIGGLEISGATAIVLDLVEMTGGLMDGILGMDLFDDVLLTLDPSKSRAVVARGALVPGGAGVIQTERGGPRMTFPIDVAGHRIMAQIDHGSPSGFTFGVEHIESLPTVAGPERQAAATMVGGNRTVRMRTLEGVVRFAGLDFENPGVSFMDPGPGLANIGSATLNDLEVTIDRRNDLIAFRRSGGAAAAGGQPQRRVVQVQGPQRGGAPGSRRTLGLQFRGTGAGFTDIASVASGSLGQRAGFRAGDEIVSLNGRPMSEYDQAALGTLIGGSEPLTWEIKRDGEKLVIEVR